jgi:nucleoside-diphosphate-sugar epimerase
MTRTLFTFGHGYTASALARRLAPLGWRLFGTSRDAANLPGIAAQGVTPLLWPGDDPRAALAQTTHLLLSAAPDETGDPVIAEFGSDMAQLAPKLEWVGYLSTTGVYGDHDGGWVDEGTALTPATRRGHHRVLAESQWQALGLPLHIFRLAGIYGPGRGPFAKVRRGTARRIVKRNQVFSRTHVEDIAQVLLASIDRPNPGAIYNVCDDDPAPPQDVLSYAAELLGTALPPEEDYETAEMTPMARSFYAESKRVRNDRIRDELGVSLLYPSYRDGLKALLADEA